MTAEVDAGAIAYRRSFPIDERDTGLSVTLRCVEHGLPLVSQLLADAAAAAIPALEQDRAGGRFFGPGVPDDGVLRWTLPARRIVDFVRACDYRPFASPWGHPPHGRRVAGSRRARGAEGGVGRESRRRRRRGRSSAPTSRAPWSRPRTSGSSSSSCG